MARDPDRDPDRDRDLNPDPDTRGGDAGADPGPDSDSDPRFREDAQGVDDSSSGTGVESGAGGVALDVEAESGPAAFMQALEVPRNGKIGVVVGLCFSVAVFVFFVVIPGSYRSPLWYLGLGFVLAMSTAGLVAFVLTVARAIRLSRDL